MSRFRDDAADQLIDHLRRLDDPIEFAAAGSVSGRAWIAGLPALIFATCLKWNLEIENGVANNGYHAIVLPVRRDGEPYALKLSWPTDRIVDEVIALRAWNGNGAVQLVNADADLGVILMERLDPLRTLRSLNLTDAAGVAGRLLRQLAVPAPPGLRQLTDLVRELTQSFRQRQECHGHPIPNIWLDAACSHCQRLEEVTNNTFLVYADLHYGNIVAGNRATWLAIDPKPIAGDPEHAVPELLWRRANEIEHAEGIRRLLTVIVES
ncbi:MAG TPA: aminoglycoside phosphotransferase family protein, partial [Nitrolancea sp.]|nr:aminoglycoside phosphotransferase family protein [Nitrolancea sp.]